MNSAEIVVHIIGSHMIGVVLSLLRESICEQVARTAAFVVRVFSASRWNDQIRACRSEQVARTATRSADRRVCGLRLLVDEGFSMARDGPGRGRDADRKIGGPRYQLWPTPRK